MGPNRTRIVACPILLAAPSWSRFRCGSSAQGVWSPLCAVRRSAQGVWSPLCAVRRSAQGVWRPLCAVRRSAQGVWSPLCAVRRSAQGVCGPLCAVRRSAQGVWSPLCAVRRSAQGVCGPLCAVNRRSAQGVFALARWSRLCALIRTLLFWIGFVSYFCAPLRAAAHWTELNIGPFYVDTDSDTGAARDTLTQLEQVRWVLGGLLESKDLPSVWPIRVMLTNSAKTNPSSHFVWQNAQYLLVSAPGTRVPLDQAAGILLDSNTPQLPAEVEAGLRQLFATLQATGSRVTWGGPPAHPDFAWARI